MDKHYIGIDNGVSGAVAILNPDGSIRGYRKIDVYKDGKRNRVDVEKLNELLRSYRGSSTFEKTAVIHETVGGSKSASAAASMADSFGRIETTLILGGWRRFPISAAKWQKFFWSKPKMAKGQKFDTKAAALKVAKQLWPGESFLATERSKVPHDGIVDALLIAEYGRRNGL